MMFSAMTTPRRAQRYLPQSTADAITLRELPDDGVLMQAWPRHYFLDVRPRA
jgi:hypothetical protein